MSITSSSSSSSTSFLSGSRESSIFLARLSEQAERYEEMLHHTRHLITTYPAITLEERSLFSVALKGFLGSRRGAWRILCYIEQREMKKGNERGARMTRGTLAKVAEEVRDACVDATEVMSKHLIPSAKAPEDKVFYNKMLGDYNRYLTELSPLPSSSTYATAAFEAYQLAQSIAETFLPSTHPTRLGLALNFAVFYYDVYTSPRRACHLAKAAFDTAISDLDLLTENEYRDATMILQLLRDNLVSWVAEDADADADPAEPQLV